MLHRVPCIRLLVVLLCCAGFSGALHAGSSNWPRFLGPGGMADASMAEIPDEFGPGKNVLWKQEVPGGHSSPVTWGKRLFLTGVEDGKLVVLSYRSKDGKPLWKRTFEMTGEEKFAHVDASSAAPTPVTDGKRLHVYFGAYGLVTLTLKGEPVWEHTFPFEPGMFGQGASPILHDGRLYLVRDIAGLSMVHAFDAATGEELWATPRTDAGENYASPFLWRYDDREELIVAGSTTLRAYDATTGKQRWWVEGLTAIACPSPVASGDTLYHAGWSTPTLPADRRLQTGFPEDSVPEEALASPESLIAHFDANGDGVLQPEELAPGRAKDAFNTADFNKDGAWQASELQGFLDFPKVPGENIVLAIRGGGEGNVTDSHVLWTRDKAIPYVSTPLLHGGKLYYVKKGGRISSVDAATGEPFYEAARLGEGGEYYASPVVVGDRVMIGSVRGTMFVLGTGDELEVVAENEFGEGIFATPAFGDDTMYLRTTEHLFAIGEDD